MNTGVLELNMFTVSLTSFPLASLHYWIMSSCRWLPWKIYGCLLYCPGVAWTGM